MKYFELFIWCAGHGANSVGDKPNIGSYNKSGRCERNVWHVPMLIRLQG